MQISELKYHQAGEDPMSGVRHAAGGHSIILQVVEGSGSVVMNNRLFPLSPGTVLLIDAGCVHSTSPKYPERYVRNKIILCKDELHALLQTADAQPLLYRYFEKELGGCYTLPNAAAAEIDRLFAEMAAGADGAYGALLVQANVMKILYTIAACADRGVQTANDKVSGVLFYIDRNFTAPLTLDKIAADTHISKYYLSRLFRAHTGMSVFEYITERRVSCARELLANTDRPVAVVAGEAGFDSISYFCHTFRRMEGVSPLTYRRQCRAAQQKAAP